MQQTCLLLNIPHPTPLPLAGEGIDAAITWMVKLNPFAAKAGGLNLVMDNQNELNTFRVKSKCVVVICFIRVSSA
jgi:hypothetical protein